jgi:hypothetical protein
MIGPPIAQTQFEHWPIQIGRQLGRMFQTGALRHHTVDEKVKAAHGEILSVWFRADMPFWERKW